MPSYKLIYFDARGRAEVCRLLFALADQSYEDERFTKEDWPKHKPDMPFGQVPVLEIDGKKYGQSVALSTYLAREFGYYGKTNLEGLQIDQIVHLVGDFLREAVKMHHTDEEKKAEIVKNFKEVEAPKYFGYLTKMLKDNGSGFFVGDSITLADLEVYNFAFALSKHMADLVESYSEIQALVERVEGNDKIKAYIANRKPTEF